MRLWDKGTEVDDLILDFTVGDDNILDLRLVKYDCLASMAHARMLHTIEVLTQEETEQLVEGLTTIKELAEKGEFPIKKAQEDCHTAIEAFLTDKLGEVGKKIHLGRSTHPDPGLHTHAEGDAIEHRHVVGIFYCGFG
jgi:argininosuccinate lyase